MLPEKLLCFALLALVLVAGPVRVASEDDGVDDSDVTVLTAANFDDIVGKAKFALVEFYAPWCGHCKQLKPEYAKLATEIKNYDDSIIIGKVDATVESSLASKFEIKGYPTLKWFVDGEFATEYPGNAGRDANGMLKWVRKKTGPAAATLASADDLETAEAGADVLVVGYFDGFEGDAFEAFAKVAQKAEDVSFAQTTSADVAKALGVPAGGAALIARHAGEPRAVAILEAIGAEALEELVARHKLPPTIEFTQESASKIFGAGLDRQLLLVAGEADLAPESAAYKAYRAAADAFRGKLVFVTVNLDGEHKDPVVKFFGVASENAPVVLGFDAKKGKKFALEVPLTAESVTSFAESVAEGTAVPKLKSAPVPEDNMDDDVAIVVGKTFDSIVKDTSKDVLLEVYAPWCGHCKSLEPIYKKLGKRFRKVDSVVVAKMDGTENEHPDVEIKGFPTLIFFPAGEGAAPVQYEGERTLKAMTKFIKEHATVPFELPRKDKGAKAGEEESHEVGHDAEEL